MTTTPHGATNGSIGLERRATGELLSDISGCASSGAPGSMWPR